jgi:hypothetical protein
MRITPGKLNMYLLLKLPAAYFTGVRVIYIDQQLCRVRVRHRWINQNPFKSMFWAVQGMAAELTTGALVMQKIKQSGKSISMLVANNNATFLKKARGRVTFECHQGHELSSVIDEAITSGKGQTLWMQAKGVNEEGIEVSSFNFEWTLKLKE